MIATAPTEAARHDAPMPDLTELFVTYVQGWLPDSFVRALIRMLLRNTAKRLNQCDWPQKELRFIERMRASSEQGSQSIAVDTAAANEQHYEVPTEFFLTYLGPCLKYSSCEWPSPSSTLAEAEVHTLDIYIDHLWPGGQAPDGHRVLDIGCGWGSFTLYAARRFPRCEFVCFSNSATQIAHITRTAAERGLHNVRALRLDINTLSAATLQARGVLPRPFDRVFACESLEHSRNYETLFRRIREIVDPAGRLFFQVLGHRSYTYLMDSSSWMGRNFFTGGTIPSMQLFLHFNRDLVVEKTVVIKGSEYARTLNAWMDKMHENRERCVVALTDGGSRSLGSTRFEAWRTFMLMSAEAFGLGRGQEWMVGYYILRPADAPVPSSKL